MEASPKAHYHDKKGEGGAFRFRVSLRDKVTFRSAFASKRSMQMSGQPIKNPTAGAIQKLRHQVANGQDTAFSLGSGDFNEMAKAMVASGGMADDGDFEGSMMAGNLGKLRALVDDESSDKDDAGGDDIEEDGAADAEPPKKKAKKDSTQ